MADVVDGLTDSELRTKLLEFGFPMMPITGTTRKVMVKKLKLLMENKSKINAEGRRSLSRYSSEEDSDTDLKTVKKEAKNRRVTMAAPMAMPAPSSKLPLRKNTRRNDSDNDLPPGVEEKKTVTTTTRTTKIVKMATGGDEYDTGSDSESDIVGKLKSPAAKSSPINNHDFNRGNSEYNRADSNRADSNRADSNYNRGSPVKQDYNRGSPVKSSISSSSFSRNTDKYFSPRTNVGSGDSSVATAGTASPGRYQSFNSSASDFAADRLTQIRSRLSLGSPVYDRPTYLSSVDRNTEEPASADTPFLSNFTRRLSQMSSGNLQKDDGGFKNDIIKEHDTNGASSYARSYISRSPRPRDYGRTDYHPSQENNRKNNMVSFVLIGVVLLFFIVLAILYLGIHSGGSMIEHSGYKIPYCIKTDKNSKPGHNCLLDKDVQDAIDVYTVLKPELYKRAVSHRCTDNKVKPYMTESEAVHFIKENYGLKDDYQISENLKNFEVLLFHNPSWDIFIVQSSTIDNFGEVPAESMDEVADNKGTMTTALSILYPNLPWRCSIYIKITAIFNTLLFLGGLALAGFGSRHAYKYYKHYTQKQRDEVFFMVERIVDILQSNATEGGNNYLVINHIRDMILPINERSRMQRTWDKAVEFINNSDSRIRTEVLVVEGEPCYVWRWLGPNIGNSPKNKAWQGQAFETQAGAVNSLPCSPTPCLKIRGMVEEGDRNLMTIREAVLGKCAHQCRILHCAVDMNGRCVYLKCASKEDAAIAYTNLHGWWYSGHLVTVKYLRLERYLQRYPESPLNGPPFLKAVKPCEDWTS